METGPIVNSVSQTPSRLARNSISELESWKENSRYSPTVSRSAPSNRGSLLMESTMCLFEAI
ncbi:hypothetical protein OESDEN_16034 [Oesophagostomum dentatum]|uniref:Uncharacterized protein n=1 Tax=Oesophagostomum dentatum TaxID=61180 RepID=A0A0B1SM33_OESDE|nr:hypothetical protein OESDEN_16034 [Oesophagostomum dentatum]